MTVSWATSKETGDTATPGTDYTAGNGTLSFAAGDTSKTVTVKVTGDQLDESDETLTLDTEQRQQRGQSVMRTATLAPSTTMTARALC